MFYLISDDLLSFQKKKVRLFRYIDHKIECHNISNNNLLSYIIDILIYSKFYKTFLFFKLSSSRKKNRDNEYFLIFYLLKTRY